MVLVYMVEMCLLPLRDLQGTSLLRLVSENQRVLPKGVDKYDTDQERTAKRETTSASAEKRDNEDTVGDESALDRHNGKIKESKKYQRHWKAQGID